jgi:hypothetical protein
VAAKKPAPKTKVTSPKKKVEVKPTFEELNKMIREK